MLILVVISFGGLAEVVPLFFQKQTTEPVEGLRPLTALELEGRDIYRREGCVGCHSQMVRPFRAETERYGHYNVAGEQVYEHNFLWAPSVPGLTWRVLVVVTATTGPVHPCTIRAT